MTPQKLGKEGHFGICKNTEKAPLPKGGMSEPVRTGGIFLFHRLSSLFTAKSMYSQTPSNHGFQFVLCVFYPSISLLFRSVGNRPIQ